MSYKQQDIQTKIPKIGKSNPVLSNLQMFIKSAILMFRGNFFGKETSAGCFFIWTIIDITK